MNDTQRALMAILDSHRPFDEKERRDVARIRGLILSSDHPLGRKMMPGHVTGSALVVDLRRGRVLLHYHKFLGNWLQFGGHAEDETDPADVALREAIEESGLVDLSFFPTTGAPRPVDIDIHPIPARGEMPEHLHLDFRYLMTTSVSNPPGGGEGESNQFRWLDLDDLIRGKSGIHTDLDRLFLKAQRLLDGLAS